MKRTIAFSATLALATSAGSASAYCPCYTASSSNNSHNCGVEAARGTNPSPEEWQSIFALVAQGPAGWGSAGPSVSDIGQGCGKPDAMRSVPARFPCEILKGIAMQESGWRQFCVPDTPGDQVGGASRTIISFDCGYGIGQVTSGMHRGENPGFDRGRVASDPTYNMATGTQILADKWHIANCVGDNQPSIVEDWYTAVWAYNGLAYVNNPSNPNYNANRGVWNPQVGGGAPYQEKVFGWIERAPDSSYWTNVPLAYPSPGSVGGSGSPPDLAEPSCASPTDCGNKRSVHKSYCFSDPVTPDAGAGGSGGGGGSGGEDDAGGTGGTGGSGGDAGGVGVDDDGGVIDASAGGSGGGAGAGAGGPGGGGAGGGGEVVGPGGPGGSSAADGGAQPAASAASADDGCSCRAVGAESSSRSGGTIALALLGFIGTIASRRRRS